MLGSAGTNLAAAAYPGEYGVYPGEYPDQARFVLVLRAEEAAGAEEECVGVEVRQGRNPAVPHSIRIPARLRMHANTTPGGSWSIQGLRRQPGLARIRSCVPRGTMLRDRMHHDSAFRIIFIMSNAPIQCAQLGDALASREVERGLTSTNHARPEAAAPPQGVAHSVPGRGRGPGGKTRGLTKFLYCSAQNFLKFFKSVVTLITPSSLSSGACYYSHALLASNPCGLSGRELSARITG